MKKRPLQDIVTKAPRDRRQQLHDTSDVTIRRPEKVRAPERISRPADEVPSEKVAIRQPEKKLGRRTQVAPVQDTEVENAVRPPKTREVRDTSHEAEDESRTYQRNVRGDSGADARFLRKKKGGSWFWIAAVIAVIILGVAFFLSLQFAGAKVEVFPKTEENVFIDGRFFARAEELPGELSYTSMTIERTASREVRAQAEEEVEERARGEIIIFNDFSPESQRLIKNTRFESADGMIYRIEESVDVPGQTEGPAGEKVPGEVSIEVVADSPGEEYNIDSGEFTIPGFSGTPRFEGFSARTKSPIIGGFVGTRLTVDEAQLAQVREELQKELEEELRNAAFSPSEKPENYYLFDNALFFEYSEQPQEQVDDETVEIREKGKVTSILFAHEAFAQHLAANTIAGYDGNEVYILDQEKLSVDVEPVTGEETSTSTPLYSLAVTGSATFVWTFDQDALKNDLSGREEAAIATVLTGYPGIDHIDVSFRPFWKKTFPEAPEDIEVSVAEVGA